ncbi:MAG: hypothetical protein HRT72_08920 [Flavobacteriales bacterium]|nr:hypothetical protein [Flavobacteriales bacterium]
MNFDFINSVIEKAANVLIVTCFNIPKGNILEHSKVSTMIIPPVRRVANYDGVPSNEKILPEIMEDLEKEMCADLLPGSVVLVCAGFAGKFLLKAAKDRGAVAIDFGSSVDHLLGLKTRNLELHTLFD